MQPLGVRGAREGRLRRGAAFLARRARQNNARLHRVRGGCSPRVQHTAGGSPKAVPPDAAAPARWARAGAAAASAASATEARVALRPHALVRPRADSPASRTSRAPTSTSAAESEARPRVKPVRPPRARVGARAAARARAAHGSARERPAAPKVPGCQVGADTAEECTDEPCKADSALRARRGLPAPPQAHTSRDTWHEQVARARRAAHQRAPRVRSSTWRLPSGSAPPRSDVCRLDSRAARGADSRH